MVSVIERYRNAKITRIFQLYKSALRFFCCIFVSYICVYMLTLSILKTGKAKAIRFSTLEAICKALDCQPGDILEFRE